MELDKKRREIDEVDRRILELLRRRAELAKELAEEKEREGIPFFDAAREAEIERAISSGGVSPLSREAVAAIWREIISACREAARSLVAAYLGPEGSFTHMASIRKFGSSCRFLPVRTIADVFREVEKGNADYGVVPIENSSEGVEDSTLDMFLESELKVCAETYLDIRHCLLSNFLPEQIRKVYSHPQALAQCRGWLRLNLPDVGTVEVSSTSRAAQLAKEEEGAAAIASKLAGEIYGLKVLREGIEDSPFNRTRFLVIGRHDSPPTTGRDKTSIMFSVPHKAGALYEALGPFHKHGINMTMIQSRPTRKRPFEYVFFVDFQGHRDEEKVKGALEEMAKKTLFLRVLGSYPEAG